MDVIYLFEIGSPDQINITNTKGIPGLFFMDNKYCEDYIMGLVSFLLNKLIHWLFVAPKKTWTMNRLMSPR